MSFNFWSIINYWTLKFGAFFMCGPKAHAFSTPLLSRPCLFAYSTWRNDISWVQNDAWQYLSRTRKVIIFDIVEPNIQIGWYYSVMFLHHRWFLNIWLALYDLMLSLKATVGIFSFIFFFFFFSFFLNIWVLIVTLNCSFYRRWSSMKMVSP